MFIALKTFSFHFIHFITDHVDNENDDDDNDDDDNDSDDNTHKNENDYYL